MQILGHKLSKERAISLMSHEDNPSLSPYGPLPGRSSFFSSENRILLIVVFVISAAFAIVAIGTYWNYQKTLENNYERFAEMITKVVSTQGAEMMASPLSPELKIKHFADNMIESSDDIAAIEFYNEDNQLVYQSQKNLSEAELSNAIESIAPLDNRSGRHGMVKIKLTRKTLKDIKAATSSIILWVFLGAWFTSILAVSFNTYILSKHLRTFVRGVKRLSTGDFGYKILEHDLWGELRTLAESFNDMSMRLRAYEDQNLETITFERNKLKGILLSIADGVVVCDTGGDITIINGAACQMLGYKNSEWAMGTNISDYVTTENIKCFSPLVSEFQALCKDHGGKLPEFFSKTVELPERAMKVIISPIEDSEGQTLGFVMIMHDVTREYEVDKLKTNFISNVSHELRTPVTTIKSYVDTIYNHA